MPAVKIRFSLAIILAAFISASIVFLFPQLFEPVCGGISGALAVKNCKKTDCVFVCKKYENGECVSGGEECQWECEPDDLPPTISAGITCSQWGQNGWCAGAETLNLTASDPQGKTVQISGSVGGVPFACPNGQTFCSVPLPNGSGTINYLVTSRPR
jgi:hypothetical protein